MRAVRRDVGGPDWNAEPAPGEVFDALPVPLYATDAEGVITYYNPAAAAFWGRKPTLGRERWCWRAYAGDGAPCPGREGALARALRGDAPPPGPFTAERPDGTRVRFRPYPGVLRDAAGRPAGAFAVVFTG